MAFEEQRQIDKADAAPQPGRRRLLRGGLGAAPLLMTLVSRPVLGHGRLQCTTMSASVSMPASGGGNPSVCLGRTPGFWKQKHHFDDWPSPTYWPTTVGGPGGHQATKFKSVFPTPTLPYPPSTTFLQVLDMGGGPPNSVARHLVAAALNVAKGWAPVLTLPALQGLWLQYMTTGGGTVGYYEPTAGVKWYHSEIEAYLKSTMPL
jgi:hypothetical protein